MLREPYVARIPELRERLDGPLRVAIAGKVKAGKSTLLNALVGENVAPTDASECTRVVTWYRNGHVYRVTAAMFEGPPVELRFRRTDRALEIDLDGRPPDDDPVPRRRVAVEAAAGHRADRHAGPGVDLRRRLAAHRALPRQRRGGARGRRRRHLPPAPPPPDGPVVPRGVPRHHRDVGARSTRSPCSRGPTRSARRGPTPCRPPSRSPSATAPTAGSTRCARSSCRSSA